MAPRLVILYSGPSLNFVLMMRGGLRRVLSPAEWNEGKRPCQKSICSIMVTFPIYMKPKCKFQEESATAEKVTPPAPAAYRDPAQPRRAGRASSCGVRRAANPPCRDRCRRPA